MRGGGKDFKIPATAAESEEGSGVPESRPWEGGEIVATGYVVGIQPVGS